MAKHPDRGGSLLVGHAASLTDARVIERAEATQRHAEAAAAHAVH